MSSTRLNFLRSPEYPQARARAQVDAFRRYARDWPTKSPCIAISGQIGPQSPVSAARIQRSLAQFRPTAPVDLVIDSRGGNAIEARKIYSLLRAHRGQISARVLGSCSSGATIILLAASWREAAPDAEFLLHELASDPQQLGDFRLTADMHRSIAEDMRRQNAELASFYALRTGKPRVLFHDEMLNENHISARRARELGLIHHILDPDGNQALAPTKVQP